MRNRQSCRHPTSDTQRTARVRYSCCVPPSLRAPSLAFVVALASCGSGLAITGAAPDPVSPGSTLAVQGAGFADGLELSLQDGATSIRLQGVVVVGPAIARATVPDAAPPGTYELRATLAGTSASFPGVRVVAGGARVHFLDVGQGDATLVIAPGGETLLIDGGPSDAAGVMRAAIDELAGGRLDAVILTHPHADHLGGMVPLLAGEDRVPGTPDDLVPTTRLSYLDDGQCTSDLCGQARGLRAWPFTVAAAGDSFALGDVEVAIVASDGDVGFGRTAGVDGENERSVATLITFAGKTVLVLGDLTGGGEGEADVEGPLSSRTGPVDLLRTGHHGSDTSSSAAALAAWQPRGLLLSLGTDNQFCHPSDGAFARLLATGAPMWSTGAGTVLDVNRCGATTDWPANAHPGQGTIRLDLGIDGSLVINGQTL